jgi:hypothetical protein
VKIERDSTHVVRIGMPVAMDGIGMRTLARTCITPSTVRSTSCGYRFKDCEEFRMLTGDKDWMLNVERLPPSQCCYVT